MLRSRFAARTAGLHSGIRVHTDVLRSTIAPDITLGRTIPASFLLGRNCLFLSTDRHYMELAIFEMKKCRDSPHKIKVGCVVVLNDQVIAYGYKGQDSKHIHAERAAFDALEASSTSAVGATIYSTIEPCLGTNARCSELIVENGIKEVVIGSFDINPKIRGQGYKYLTSQGVAVRGFDSDLHREVNELNHRFMDNFQRSTGPKNHCKFPYRENQNKRRLELIFSESDNRSISMRCGSLDETSVYLYADAPAEVARTSEFGKFASLHDSLLALYDFDYSAEVAANEIAVFRSSAGYALVKISNIDRDNPEVRVEFEIRLC